jgi:hypothetical protein
MCDGNVFTAMDEYEWQMPAIQVDVLVVHACLTFPEWVSAGSYSSITCNLAFLPIASNSISAITEAEHGLPCKTMTALLTSD